MKTEEMNRKQLAGMFDHTLLKADATPRDFEKLCEESNRYGSLKRLDIVFGDLNVGNACVLLHKLL